MKAKPLNWSCTKDGVRSGKEKRFVIRLNPRHHLHKGIRKDCLNLAVAMPCPHATAIIKYEEGKEQKMTISYNAVPVRLPDKKLTDYRLYFVDVKGFGKKPMMLLTVVLSTSSRKRASGASSKSNLPAGSATSRSGTSNSASTSKTLGFATTQPYGTWLCSSSLFRNAHRYI